MSANSREQSIEKLESEVFDLVVIGGGITGAGIALDAASRGLSVALLENMILPAAHQAAPPS